MEKKKIYKTNQKLNQMMRNIDKENQKNLNQDTSKDLKEDDSLKS